MRFKYLLFLLSILSVQSILLAQAPNWTIDPGDYQYSATMIAKLTVDDIERLENNTIGVFVNTEVRGTAQPIPNSGGLYFLSVYSNNVAGDTLTLETYLLAENAVFPIQETFIFEANRSWGTADIPTILHAWTDSDLPVFLDSLPPQLSIFPKVFTDVDLDSFLIQEDTDPVVWTASSSANLTASFSGSVLSVALNNSTWTGSEVITVTATEQTTNMHAATRNILYTRLPANYKPAWFEIPGQAITRGDTFEIIDLRDYEYQYAGTCLEFDYAPILAPANPPESQPTWQVSGSFQTNMTLAARAIFTPNYIFEHPDDKLGAFINGEVRGVASPVNVNGEVFFFLTVRSNSSGENIVIKFYSGFLKETLTFLVPITYVASGILGNPENPYELDFSPLLPVIIGDTTAQVLVNNSEWTGTQNFTFIAQDCVYPDSLRAEIETSFCVVDSSNVVLVNSTVHLQGAYNTSSGLMNDDLRIAGLIPISEPFSALGLVPTLGAGSEVSDSAKVFKNKDSNSVVDWILLELRDKNNPATVLHSKPFLLQSDGDVIGLDGLCPVLFEGVPADSFHLAVRHRNHLGIMTLNAISLSATAVSVDFSVEPTYGANAQKDLGGGLWGMWGGDLDHSGAVNASDRSEAWNHRNSNGYLLSDATLDGFTNASDRSVTWNNRNLTEQLP